MKNVALVPARFASTRLPGKPLLSETGRPLIIHVLDAAKRASRINRVIVATDDQRIFDAVQTHGGEAMMTRSDHATGSDRIAEVAANLPDAEIIVNLQGDEPDISGEAIDKVVRLLEDNPKAPMATIATPIRDPEMFRDPSCVKAVRDSKGRALYFSRSPIPCHRDGLPQSGQILGLLHLGLYAYRRDFLLQLSSLPQSPLESSEKLEQLRVLEAGYEILIDVVEERSVGIDTPEDYRRFVERWRLSQSS